MIDWPEHLVNGIALRRSVLFLGAGISANSTNDKGEHPKTWHQLLLELTDDLGPDTKGLVTAKINREDYLTASELIFRKIGKDRFFDLLRKEFIRPAFQPNEFHKCIFQLDSRYVITPNIDKIYEVYAQNSANGTITVKNYYDSDLSRLLRSQDRYILKMHGTLDEPWKMIFTRLQYTLARNDYASFYRLVEALIMNYTFVFLGAGIADPDIRLLMEDVAFTFPNGPKHYYVIPKNEISPDELDIERESRNIEFIQFDNSKGDYSELLDGLKELVALVESQREDIRESMNW